MRCEQCIFQGISSLLSLSSSSSSRCNARSSSASICSQCNVDIASGKRQNLSAAASSGRRAKPTEIKDLVLPPTTSPLIKLIMDSFPVKIEWSNVLGRYLVTTRDIRQCELIFQCEPIVAGPTPSYTEKDWICMSCFRVAKKKTMVRCSDCQWPFCGEYCAEDDIHKELECLVLAKAKVLPEDNYTDHITLMQLLRCLLTKHKDPEGWQQLMAMESHVEGRKQSTSDVWEKWRKEEIKFIRNTLGLTEFNEEEINFISGVLSMNAFGSNDVHGPRHRHGSYLYYLGGMAAHDCAPNTDYEVDENQIFNLKAIVDIPKGSIITLSYALPFQGTLLRRDYLKDYFFDCCCKRCSDALEFGSYFSALKCSACEEGVLLPDHPLVETSPWKCSTSGCMGAKTHTEVFKLLKDFDNLRESNEYASDTTNHLKNIENLERLMERGKPLFHPNHFSLMGVEFELIQKIQYYLELGKIPWKWNDRLLELTRKQIEVGQLIWPGWNDRYGRLMYLLQAALLNSLVEADSGNKSESGAIKYSENKDKHRSKIIKEVLRIREVAKKVLLSKPAGSYEHALGMKLKGVMSKETTEADLVARVEKLSLQ